MKTKMTEIDAKRFYGADGAEWLARWDRGDIVWSVQMGGLGPGYEQCIQITTAEILRHMLAARYDADAWKDSDAWRRDESAISAAVMAVPVVKELGLSGAQWGAACGLAAVLYKRGPLALLDDEVEDRRIQVSRRFPS